VQGTLCLTSETGLNGRDGTMPVGSGWVHRRRWMLSLGPGCKPHVATVLKRSRTPALSPAIVHGSDENATIF
jgi:hypothetical protein